MARKRRVPGMNLHKPSGQARVRLAGRDIYLGPWGTPATEAEYRRVIAEWLASGTIPARQGRRSSDGTTVGELARAYRDHILQQVSKRDYQQTVRPSLVRLDRLYGHTLAADFSPASLEALLLACVDEVHADGRRLSRAYINRKILPTIKRLFKWGARKRLVTSSVWYDLSTVERVKRGYSGVPDLEPIRPVSDSVVQATIAELSPVLADMVQVQRLSGMRPSEVCALTLAEIDRTGQVWRYCPKHHKTAHHGISRTIALGPRAQAILMKYLNRQEDVPLFSPSESIAKQRALARAARRTPVQPSQHARDLRAAEKPRRYRDGYHPNAYRLAVARAVKRAFRPKGMTNEEFQSWACPQHWHPNQLRHTRATEIRTGFGLDAAGAVLGHTKLETTQIYAERNAELAMKIALATG